MTDSMKMCIHGCAYTDVHTRSCIHGATTATGWAIYLGQVS